MAKVKSDQELELAAEIVNWEFKHLVHSVKHYVEFKGNTARPDLGTIAFEAFLLHYRNVREFLSEKPEQDDMRAEDLCSGWERPIWPDHLKDHRASSNANFSETKRLNKALAHLTFFRVELKLLGAPDWPVEQMYETARNYMLLFCARASSDTRYKETFKESSELLAKKIAFAAFASSNSTETKSSFNIL